MKSIKLAEELSMENQRKHSADKMKEKLSKGDKLAE